MGVLLHPGPAPFEPVPFGPVPFGPVPFEEVPADGARAARPIVRSSPQACGLDHLGPCECRPVFLRLLVWALRRSRC